MSRIILPQRHSYAVIPVGIYVNEKRRSGFSREQAGNHHNPNSRLKPLLPIFVVPLTVHNTFGRRLTLARAYNLSSYDACYLELAIRESIAIATLDKKLQKSAIDSNVQLYLKPAH